MTEEFEKDMMHDLRAQGMILDEIVDLMNLSLVHRAIVPLLLTYFEKDYSEEDKEFLARCLADQSDRCLDSDFGAISGIRSVFGTKRGKKSRKETLKISVTRHHLRLQRQIQRCDFQRTRTCSNNLPCSVPLRYFSRLCRGNRSVDMPDFDKPQYLYSEKDLQAWIQEYIEKSQLE